jgi:pyruvate dehydrogenase E1 component
VRSALRRHFEVDAAHVVVGVLDGLAQMGEVKAETVAEAIERFAIDAEAPDPRTA